MSFCATAKKSKPNLTSFGNYVYTSVANKVIKVTDWQDENNRLIIEYLENEGARRIFGTSESTLLPLFSHIKQSPIEYISASTAKGAALMAYAHSYWNECPGIYISPSDELAVTYELMNLLGEDRAPLISLTAYREEENHKASLMQILEPITEWNNMPSSHLSTRARRRKFELTTSCLHELKHFPGLLGGRANAGRDNLDDEGLCPHDCSIKGAANLISKAKNPLILVGREASRKNLWKEVTGFAERLHIPVVTTLQGKGIVPYSHPLLVGSVGVNSGDAIRFDFDHIDTAIAVGFSPEEFFPEEWNANHEISIIHISSQGIEESYHYSPVSEIVGDIADSLDSLLFLSDRQEYTESHLLSLRSDIRSEYEDYIDDIGFPLKPQRLVSDVRSVLNREDIVVTDVGLPQDWFSRYYPLELPRTCILPSRAAAQGCAIPGAIVAKLEFPERNVIAAVELQTFLEHPHELQTALKHGTPFVTLLFNNGTSEEQHYQAELDQLVADLGILKYRISSTSSLLSILSTALSQSVPTVIDCPVDSQVRRWR